MRRRANPYDRPMPIPRVAIVGRPNAGKSSLMNMVAGAKVSIVDPTPGVTRDRVTAIVELQAPDGRGPERPVEFVDTGGFGVYAAEGARYDEVGADLATLTEPIEAQIRRAVEDADLVLFAIDAQQGVTPHDQEIARMLREGWIGRRGGRARAGAHAPRRGASADDHGESRASPRPAPMVRIVATKVDGPKWEAHALELSGLGFGEPLMCSAKTNYFRRDFLESVYALLPEGAGDEPRAHADLMLAIVGKRNAGKSTLVNTLAGEARMIVSEIAGTTRDAVDVRFEWSGKSLVAIDTAGLRRKRSLQGPIEVFALDRAKRAIDRADVVLLLLDATEPISQVDEQLAAMVQASYKPVVVCVNKWDLAEGRADAKGRPATPARYEEYIRNELKAMWFAPVSFIVGSSGRNVRRTIDLAFELKEQSEARVTTGKLNRMVQAIVSRRGPTDTKGTFAKVFYVAQTGVAPPTITLVVNHPELFTPNYLRFLMNRFREELAFKEVPMRVVVRARRQREDDLGDDRTVRTRRGRKGVDVRARARAGQAAAGANLGSVTPGSAGYFDEAILSDDASAAVDTGLDQALASGDFDEPAPRPQPKRRGTR